MTRPANVEYAGGGSQITDDQLRVKLRNAPAWVKNDIEAYRERRGLPRLFATRAGVAVSRSPAPAAPVKVPARAKNTAHSATCTLICPAAPGVSYPTSITKHGLELPEFISPAAWSKVCNDLRSGKHVPVTLGHGGKVLTTTASPRFRYINHPTAGLLCEVDLVWGDPTILNGTGVSIGFRDAKYHEGVIDGKRVRIVDELRLLHIALLVDREELPAYKLARLKWCRPRDARSSKIDTIIDIGRAIKAQWPTLLNLAR